MSSPAPPKLLFVLGMHRSGTSALCAALAASGASFGNQLIDAMAGVNEEGFWEDAAVVAVNEQLLALADSSWFALAPGLADTDWTAARFHPLREQAARLLQSGFGDSPLQAVKDPRLCLTLPFWLSLCEQLGISSRVCVISRAPLEVARSLEKRDGFPLGYGLRLYAGYRDCMDRWVPAEALSVSYAQLLDDAPGVIQRLANELPLTPGSTGLAGVVRGDLRHQSSDLDDPLSRADIDPGSLRAEIEAVYPTAATLGSLAASLVTRGMELTRIGEAHSTVLATLAQRDKEMDALAKEHRQALATIAERDAQIRDFDQRLTETGEHLGKALAVIDELNHIGELHTHALEVIRDKDEHLQRVLNTPGMGLVFKAMWKRAGR